MKLVKVKRLPSTAYQSYADDLIYEFIKKKMKVAKVDGARRSQAATINMAAKRAKINVRAVIRGQTVYLIKGR